MIGTQTPESKLVKAILAQVAVERDMDQLSVHSKLISFLGQRAQEELLRKVQEILEDKQFVLSEITFEDCLTKLNPDVKVGMNLSVRGRVGMIALDLGAGVATGTSMDEEDDGGMNVDTEFSHPHTGNNSSTPHQALRALVVPCLVAASMDQKIQYANSLVSQFSAFALQTQHLDVNEPAVASSILSYQESLLFRLNLFAPLVPFIKRQNQTSKQPTNVSGQSVATTAPTSSFKGDDCITVLFKLLANRVVQITDEMDIFSYILDILFALLSLDQGSGALLERPEKQKVRFAFPRISFQPSLTIPF
jgi:hypothetical protein